MKVLETRITDPVVGDLAAGEFWWATAARWVRARAEEQKRVAVVGFCVILFVLYFYFFPTN
jgi:hypothetical protein